MPVRKVPEGYHNVTPYLIVRDAHQVLEFLKQAFGAEQKELMLGPDGKIGHAEVQIGDSIVMMGEAGERWKPMPTSLYVYVSDTDATYKRALELGASSLMEPADQFYGDRNAGVSDPSGNFWWIATHIEDVSQEELERRAKELAKKAA